MKLQGQCPAEGRYWLECQCDFFLKKMERAVCMYGWKMKHRVRCQWFCGEAEGHAVIHPLCRIWG